MFRGGLPAKIAWALGNSGPCVQSEDVDGTSELGGWVWGQLPGDERWPARTPAFISLGKLYTPAPERPFTHIADVAERGGGQSHYPKRNSFSPVMCMGLFEACYNICFNTETGIWL